MEDPFYNFEELGDRSLGIQSILDPSNPNAIPFFDDCFTGTPPPPFAEQVEGEEGLIGMEGVAEFDAELFNSILTTGDDILARLESTSSASGGNISVAFSRSRTSARTGISRCTSCSTMRRPVRPVAPATNAFIGFG